MAVQRDVRRSGRRRLLLFGVGRLDEILAKGNVWYVRHYEAYFDEVYVVYLYGYHAETITQGNTTLISVGGRHGSFWLALALSPWRLLRMARRLRPNVFLTADIIFSWWTASLIRLVLHAPVVLMPVCILPEVHASTGRSLSGLPIVVERFLAGLSFLSARKIIMGRNSEASLAWLRSERCAVGKLQVVAATVEEFPAAELMDALLNQTRTGSKAERTPQLLYVGRLHPEKRPEGLVDMMAELRALGVPARLVVAGDGSCMMKMRQQAHQLGVQEDIEWLGFVTSAQLADIYRDADVFVSTVTGTALREAGLAGLPVVAYDVDWVRDLMRHEETALLVPPGDSKALAREVAKALKDDSLRERIAADFSKLARSRWGQGAILRGLQEAFD